MILFGFWESHFKHTITEGSGGLRRLIDVTRNLNVIREGAGRSAVILLLLILLFFLVLTTDPECSFLKSDFHFLRLQTRKGSFYTHVLVVFSDCEPGFLREAEAR